LSPTEIKILYDEIHPFKYELNTVFKTTDKGSKKEYFLAFFRSIENISISDSDYDEVMSFLDSNLQEDQVFWNEEKIRLILKDWYINKLKQNPKIEGGGSVSSSGDIKSPQPSDDIALKEEKERIIKKIQMFKGDFIKVLSELLDRHSEIRYVLERLLDSEGK
jgi:hypothetical protein